MKLKEVGKQLDAYAPPRYAEDWDNVGWMVGCLDDEITGALICVDVTRDVIQRAIDEDFNLVIAHHPLIYEPFNQLVSHNPSEQLAMKAIRNHCSVYSIHTNADSMPGGLNDLFADVLSLEGTVPVAPHDEDPDAGLGRKGRLRDPLTLRGIEEILREELPISHMKVLGQEKTDVEHVAVCTGSGGDLIDPELAEECDLYITGDVGHHTALEARQLDLPLIILDHYEMETVFLTFGRRLWKEQFGSRFPFETVEHPLPYRHNM
ncbi:MAG: Nif3-like dinuclear metal center hexameric protein [bacterium]